MQKNIELVKKAKGNFIALSKAKTYLRINHDHEDEIIQDMLNTAIEVAENYMGRKILETTWKLTIWDNLPSKIKLFGSPIVKIESFKLFRQNDEVSYLTKDHYVLDTNHDNLYLRRSFYMVRAEITYSSGYPEANIPAPIMQGILEHLVKLYDLRGSDQTLPLAAKSLYAPYKRVRL